MTFALPGTAASGRPGPLIVSRTGRCRELRPRGEDITTTRQGVLASGSCVAPGRLRIALILGALIALAPLTIDTYIPALPVIGPDLGAAATTAQLILTGTLIGLALGQVPIGPLSDSFGRRAPLLAGAVLHVPSSAAVAITPRAQGDKARAQLLADRLRWPTRRCGPRRRFLAGVMRRQFAERGVSRHRRTAPLFDQRVSERRYGRGFPSRRVRPVRARMRGWPAGCVNAASGSR